MDVSSVAGAASVAPPPPPPPVQPFEAKRPDDKDDTRLAAPAAKPPLPPGQGTRIDQLA